MRKAPDRQTAAALTVTAVLVIIVAAAALLRPERPLPGEVRCMLDIGSYADTSKSLIVGYNYHLLERFAADLDRPVEISIARQGCVSLDSLRLGAISIAVIPAADSLPSGGGFLRSVPIDGISTWVFREGDRMALYRKADAWLREYSESPHHDPVLESFLRTYTPSRRARTGKKYSYLSPYDDLIREYADSLGWDWRLLAAVVYQESHFRLDVRSRRGAEGLMQMMPKTAGRMEAGDLVNPRSSISAGTRYLKMLEGYYYKWTRDPAERRKYTLAAYNAGHGRIRDCINYALLRGKDVSKWAETASVIPEMNSEQILQVDTVKLGRFKGRETIAYVDSVMEIYDCFRQICP